MNTTKDKPEDFARDFLNRYGSHFPAGVQTLGGVLISIADVHSTVTTSTSTLAKEAVTFLKCHMSARLLDGAFGVEANVAAGNKC